MYALRAVQKQDARAFGNGGSGGDDVVDEKNALSFRVMSLLGDINARHVGPAGFRRVDTRLGLSVTDLPEQSLAGQPQLPGRGLGKQPRLIVAPAAQPPAAQWPLNL